MTGRRWLPLAGTGRYRHVFGEVITIGYISAGLSRLVRSVGYEKHNAMYGYGCLLGCSVV